MRNFSTKLFLLIILLLNMPVYAQPHFLNHNEEKNNIFVYEKISPAIVSIECDTKEGVSSGTGCIIRNDGLILTSSHVVEDGKNIEVTTSNGKTYSANVVTPLEEKTDLALIKINVNELMPTVELGDSAKVKTGQKVLAIGNPFGFNGTLTTGIVSRIDYTKNKIQTDAAINPGSSGGPIINTSGKVIGISQSIFNPDNNKSNIGIGFAVPINEAKKYLAETKI